MTYSVVLVSGVQQSESVLYIYIYITYMCVCVCVCVIHTYIPLLSRLFSHMDY